MKYLTSSCVSPHLDTDHMQIPCWFLSLLGVVFQLDLNGVGGDTGHIYYPVLLVCLTGVGMLNPLKLLHYRIRIDLVQSLVCV